VEKETSKWKRFIKVASAGLVKHMESRQLRLKMMNLEANRLKEEAAFAWAQKVEATELQNKILLALPPDYISEMWKSNDRNQAKIENRKRKQ
jgi:hypothetical protein